VILNLLHTIPIVISFIPYNSWIILSSYFWLKKTALFDFSYLLVFPHFFLPLLEDAALAILSFVFLAPLATGYFP